MNKNFVIVVLGAALAISLLNGLRLSSVNNALRQTSNESDDLVASAIQKMTFGHEVLEKSNNAFDDSLRMLKGSLEIVDFQNRIIKNHERHLLLLGVDIGPNHGVGVFRDFYYSVKAAEESTVIAKINGAPFTTVTGYGDDVSDEYGDLVFVTTTSNESDVLTKH